MKLRMMHDAKFRENKTLGKISELTVNTIFCLFICLFDLILYIPSTIFQLNRDGSSWVEPVLS